MKRKSSKSKGPGVGMDSIGRVENSEQMWAVTDSSKLWKGPHAAL